MMILAILAIIGVLLFLAICVYSLWYLRHDWRQESGYRAYVKRIWDKQDGYR